MTCVLVTGASGFIGRSLVEALRRAGWRVRAGARKPEGAGFAHDVETVRLPDLAAPIDWAPLLEGVTHVVHLAGIAHKGAEVPDEAYERVNRAAVAGLAAQAARSGVQRLIFVSSIAAQSGPSADHVLTEADTPRPTTIYGRTKLAAEADLRASGAPYTILRPVVTYGLDAPGNIATLVRLAALPLPLPFGAFETRRSLLAIDNLNGAVAFALAEPKTTGETYIVADPNPLTLPDIIAALRAGMRRPPRLINISPRLFAGALRLARRGDIWDRLGGSLVASPARLLAAGWRPVVATRDGLFAMTAARRGLSTR
jgi:nucleoside-diphosphate-sugar epimerase